MAGRRNNTSDKQQSIYVIAGKDASLANAECDRLLDKLIEPAERATGLLNVEADKITITEVMDELRTLPFLASKRIVVLKDADKFISANRELLENYFDNPSPTGILIMTVSSLDARTKLAKKLPKVGKLIQVSQPSASQLPAKLRQYALEAHAKTLKGETLELLIELAGEDLSRLYSEIDKLAVFVADNKSITAADVQALVGHNRIYNAFDIIDSVIARDAARAVDQLRRLFGQDRSAEYTFVGALAYHLRRMFTAKVMLKKGRSQWDVGKSLRIWHRADAFFGQVSKASLAEIGLLIQRLAQTDYEIKTGRATARTAIEELVMTMARP